MKAQQSFSGQIVSVVVVVNILHFIFSTTGPILQRVNPPFLLKEGSNLSEQMKKKNFGQFQPKLTQSIHWYREIKLSSSGR